MAFHGGTPAGVPSAGAAVAGRAGRSFSEVGRLLARLRPRGPDRDLRYRTLFECVSDGFAVVEVIRDGAGEVIDYVVLEANPALLKMLGWDASPVGKRQSELVRGAPPAWLKACGRAVDGGPLSFEYSAPRSQRWFEVRLSPMGRNCLA